MSVMAVDIGNSNTKFQIEQGPINILSNREIIAPDVSRILSAAEAKTVTVSKTVTVPDAVTVSSVISDKITQEILAYLVQQLNLNPNTIQCWTSAQILKHALPLQYLQLSHLGSDRALRIYYLSQLAHDKPQIGIGCGSAFTIEVVYQQQLIESMIIPGLSMQLDSLSSKTAKLPKLEAGDVEAILAQQAALTTNYAIANGIISSYLAIIGVLCKRYTPQQVICSGGYAHLLSKYWNYSNYKLTTIKHLEIQVLQDLAQNKILM